MLNALLLLLYRESLCFREMRSSSAEKRLQMLILREESYIYTDTEGKQKSLAEIKVSRSLPMHSL